MSDLDQVSRKEVSSVAQRPFLLMEFFKLAGSEVTYTVRPTEIKV